MDRWVNAFDGSAKQDASSPYLSARSRFAHNGPMLRCTRATLLLTAWLVPLGCRSPDVKATKPEASAEALTPVAASSRAPQGAPESVLHFDTQRLAAFGLDL